MACSVVCVRPAGAKRGWHRGLPPTPRLLERIQAHIELLPTLLRHASRAIGGRIRLYNHRRLHQSSP